MVEKWDPVPGPSGPLEPLGPSEIFETPSYLQDPAEPVEAPRISLGQPWDHWYSSGCDT